MDAGSQRTRQKGLFCQPPPRRTTLIRPLDAMIPQGKETAPAHGGRTEAACVRTPDGGVTGAGLASRVSCTRVKESNLLILELFRPFSENC